MASDMYWYGCCALSDAQVGSWFSFPNDVLRTESDLHYLPPGGQLIGYSTAVLYSLLILAPFYLCRYVRAIYRPDAPPGMPRDATENRL